MADGAFWSTCLGHLLAWPGATSPPLAIPSPLPCAQRRSKAWGEQWHWAPALIVSFFGRRTTSVGVSRCRRRGTHRRLLPDFCQAAGAGSPVTLPGHRLTRLSEKGAGPATISATGRAQQSAVLQRVRKGWLYRPVGGRQLSCLFLSVTGMGAGDRCQSQPGRLRIQLNRDEASRQLRWSGCAG